MKLHKRTMLAAALMTTASGALINLTQFASNSAPADSISAPASSFAAQVAERLYASGSSNVILTSGTTSSLNAAPALDAAQSLVAAQALASRLGGPVLITQDRNNLGPATFAALNTMAVPNVDPIDPLNPLEVQPFQPAAGLPTLYLVGDPSSFSGSLVKSLRTQGYPTILVTSPTAAGLFAAVQAIVAPPMPSGADATAFPSSWTTYAASQDHNSAFPTTSTTPNWLRQGVSWNFAEAAAVPFSSGYADVNQLGPRSAPVKMTQNLGNAVGVTAVGGVIYAESDDYHLYAIDAHTGKQLWESPVLVNSLMGNPIVANNMIYVTTGDTGFPFSQLLRFFLSGGKYPLTRGLMYSSIYAFNQQTGRMVWRADFKGEAMASPVVVGTTVYEPTGGGNLWAFNGATGAEIFKTPMGGFDSMSSPNTWTDPKTKSTEVIVGTSDQSNVVAIDSQTGKPTWTQNVSSSAAGAGLTIFNTGMGDNSPAVDQTNNMVFQDSVVNFNKAAGTVNLAVYAMDASTGNVLWATTLGSGLTPPAYKSGIVTVQNGVVYVGSPVTSQLFAINEMTGKIQWTFNYTNAGPAGAGRGGVVLYNGILWSASGPNIYAINPTNGALISKFAPGGRFGIVNPVIVGGTMYLDNSYDWIQAIPLTTIDPSYKSIS